MLENDLRQGTADNLLGDWFEYTIGLPIMDLTAAPYGGARYSVKVRMGARIFARFHLDVRIGDAVIQPLETVARRDRARLCRHPKAASAYDSGKAAVRRKDSRLQKYLEEVLEHHTER